MGLRLVNRDKWMTRSPGHHAVLNFHEPMHRNLIFDPGVKDPQAEEKPAAEEKDAGNKDQHEISREERSNIFEDNGEDETQQDHSSPEDHFHLAE